MAASAVQGLMAADELLGLSHENEVRRAIRKLLLALIDQDKTGGVPGK
jgi:hypothetical protein